VPQTQSQTEPQPEDQGRISERFNAILAADFNLRRIVQTATDAGRELIGAGFGAFFYNLPDKNGESCKLYTLSGAAPEDFSGFPMSGNPGIFVPIFNGERAIRLDDVTQDPRYGQHEPYRGMPPGRLPVRSYLAVPVLSRSGEVLGGLFYGHPQSGIFTARAEGLVEGVARQAAVAIEAERTHNLLMAIVDSSDDAIIGENLDGVITSWNQGAERMFGYTAAEALGRRITLIIPADRYDEEANIIERIKQANRVDRFETVRMGKKETLLDVSLTISPVKDIGGRVVGASKTARDITRTKRLERVLRENEERLRALSDGLEIQVRSRTQELEQRNGEILRQSEQLRDLSRCLLKIQDDERRHIARELHDSVGQLLTVLGMTLAGITAYVTENPSLRKALEDSQDLVRELSREIRTTTYLLHPPLLDDSGLLEAIQWYLDGLAERSGLAVEFNISEDFGRLPADLELAIFRIVQECLTNIHRHSGSKTATIRISRGADGILLEIQDNGKGISDEKLAAIKAHRTGVGITGMHERVCQFKGVMDIQSNGNGATVLAIFPVPNAPLPPSADSLNSSDPVR